ncbi:Domain of unknown function DUF11 [Seminavis robusta]|uniref:Uncharacterized protein n=1 Tax=Seminavis robusta TaxID=568900 RepID=A0A9N8EC29_9STRA|nr:Domain of unknown function DUF11 [Seminavis robusta]|eukprot:Sro928_g221260.1 Domain of unknown function DUF11 (648) ;mRNA; r:28878-30821
MISIIARITFVFLALVSVSCPVSVSVPVSLSCRATACSSAVPSAVPSAVLSAVPSAVPSSVVSLFEPVSLFVLDAVSSVNATCSVFHPETPRSMCVLTAVPEYVYLVHLAPLFASSLLVRIAVAMFDTTVLSALCACVFLSCLAYRFDLDKTCRRSLHAPFHLRFGDLFHASVGVLPALPQFVVTKDGQLRYFSQAQRPPRAPISYLQAILRHAKPHHRFIVVNGNLRHLVRAQRLGPATRSRIQRQEFFVVNGMLRRLVRARRLAPPVPVMNRAPFGPALPPPPPPHLDVAALTLMIDIQQLRLPLPLALPLAPPLEMVPAYPPLPLALPLDLPLEMVPVAQQLPAYPPLPLPLPLDLPLEMVPANQQLPAYPLSSALPLDLPLEMVPVAQQLPAYRAPLATTTTVKATILHNRYLVVGSETRQGNRVVQQSLFVFDLFFAVSAPGTTCMTRTTTNATVRVPSYTGRLALAAPAPVPDDDFVPAPPAPVPDHDMVPDDDPLPVPDEDIVPPPAPPAPVPDDDVVPDDALPVPDDDMVPDDAPLPVPDDDMAPPPAPVPDHDMVPDDAPLPVPDDDMVPNDDPLPVPDDDTIPVPAPPAPAPRARRQQVPASQLRRSPRIAAQQQRVRRSPRLASQDQPRVCYKHFF